ncbi:MAG: hypothetical protein LBQ14_07040 [Treponema sp.]|nr:hypothetical protein [Treponema sp.]
MEAEIAHLLGKADWNEVVLEARSAVTGKSVETIRDELARQRAERENANRDRLHAALSGVSRKRRAG